MWSVVETFFRGRFWLCNNAQRWIAKLTLEFRQAIRKCSFLFLLFWFVLLSCSFVNRIVKRSFGSQFKHLLKYLWNVWNWLVCCTKTNFTIITSDPDHVVCILSFENISQIHLKDCTRSIHVTFFSYSLNVYQRHHFPCTFFSFHYLLRSRISSDLDIYMSVFLSMNDKKWRILRGKNSIK